MDRVYRHLYPQVYAWENLLHAWAKARKGKRGHPPAASFEMNVAENLHPQRPSFWKKLGL